jgi:hypothetical protein
LLIVPSSFIAPEIVIPVHLFVTILIWIDKPNLDHGTYVVKPGLMTAHGSRNGVSGVK